MIGWAMCVFGGGGEAKTQNLYTTIVGKNTRDFPVFFVENRQKFKNFPKCAKFFDKINFVNFFSFFHQRYLKMSSRGTKNN